MIQIEYCNNGKYLLTYLENYYLNNPKYSNLPESEKLQMINTDYKRMMDNARAEKIA